MILIFYRPIYEYYEFTIEFHCDELVSSKLNIFYWLDEGLVQ